ncbi:MAG: amphi-Trp domain-containing protein [Desulfovibrio sp.]|jgi:amphi-Trp domain-containing protein|nr:amphi-Trp domain-containing protein [Desulfovibrio sp.]
MAAEKKFIFESLQDIKSISSFLEAIVEGMQTGKILLSSSDECIEMHPNGLLHLSIKAKKKGGNNKIGIKVEWKETQNQEQNTVLSVGK